MASPAAEGSVFELRDNRQLYEVLGVARTAATDEIKRAYKKLAIVFHPDKNPAGAERFKEIAFAHGILADDDQRRMYDSSTLRKHIDGKAKAYDPAMDPNVELSASQLREFVERLRREGNDGVERQRAFEERREAEMRRQEEYNLRRPGFQMPDVPTTSASVEGYKAQQRTTAELMEHLNNVTGKPAGPTPSREEEAIGSLRGGGMKSQMLADFRSRRQEQGMSTVAEVTHKPEVLRDLDARKYNFVTETASVPSYAQESRRTATERKDFDYKGFVVRELNDGGVVKEAILADALGDYDPEN